MACQGGLSFCPSDPEASVRESVPGSAVSPSRVSPASVPCTTDTCTEERTSAVVTNRPRQNEKNGTAVMDCTPSKRSSSLYARDSSITFRDPAIPIV